MYDLIPVIQRRAIKLLAEGTGEMRRRIKACGQSNLADTQLCLAQKIFGIIHPFQANIFHKSDTQCLSLVEKPLTSELVQLGCWVIPQASEHKEAAMKILNLMYTNRDYVTLYTYGIEGIHYLRNSEGGMQVLLDRYTQNLTWMFGNCLLASADLDAAGQNLEDYKNASYSPYFGFLYNDERYTDEIADMQNILAAWLPELENGKNPDIDGALKQMNEELYAAGLTEVIRDKQQQLDQWLKNK